MPHALPIKSRAASHRRQEYPKEADWKIFASGIRRHIARYRHHDKLILAGILALESGLPLEEWYALRTGRRPRGKGTWAPLPIHKEWDLLCYLFGIRSEDDLKRVLNLADLEKRTNEEVPDRRRDRLDRAVRALARQESRQGVTIYHSKPKDNQGRQERRYLPPYRAQTLALLVDLVNSDPMRLSRWYVASLLHGLHVLGWNGSAAEKRRARALGSRLGKAVTQPLRKGRIPSLSPLIFREHAALYKSLVPDVFGFTRTNTPRKEVVTRLLEAHPKAPRKEIEYLVDLARSPGVKTPHRLLIAALRSRFPNIQHDRSIYRLLSR